MLLLCLFITIHVLHNSLNHQLLSEEDFCNRLNNDNISDENYEDAKKVWNIYKYEKIKDYHEIYQKVDYTLLLADVFENFRQTCLGTYKVDPSY